MTDLQGSERESGPFRCSHYDHGYRAGIAEAEALAEALEFIAGMPAAYKTCPCNGCKVLREYRARHPKATA